MQVPWAGPGSRFTAEFEVQVVDVVMLPLTRISAAIALWAIIDEPITSANVLPMVLIFISWSFLLKGGAETDWTKIQGVLPRIQTPRCKDDAFCHSFSNAAYLFREPFVQIASALRKSLCGTVMRSVPGGTNPACLTIAE